MTSELGTWAWPFVLTYIGGMIAFGIWGQRRVSDADDFATARSGYGPLVLAVAFASTTASGATFLGLPALAYSFGVSALWIGIVYPIAIYGGLFVCQRLIARSGHRFGNRSIPEYLGDRFQSETLRVLTAVASLALLFLLAGQLVAGLAMFEMLLGLPKGWALLITMLVLMVYVGLGGAHADILTDTLQGALMLLIAVGIGWMFFTGFGVEGGFPAMVERARAIDPAMFAPMHAESPVTGSLWALTAMFIAYVPFGFLPYLGNKVWALREERQQRRFVALGFVFGILLPVATLAGVLARVVLGDALYAEGTNPNSAIPALFAAVLPAWFAALLGAAILSAIMSTADGLVISTSQVFANDIYRRTLAPRLSPGADARALDRRVLAISRVATVATLAAATVLAWYTLDINIVLLTWIGLGGLVAGIAAPVVLGVLWPRMTRAGALASFVTGMLGFALLHYGWLPADALGGTPLAGIATWLAAQQPNPYACAALAEMAAVAVAVGGSLVTRPLPEAHLDSIFDRHPSGGAS